MEFSNEGKSFYHRFQPYLHQGSGQRLSSIGPRQLQTPHDTNLKAYRQNRDVLDNNRAHNGGKNSNSTEEPEPTAFDAFFVQLILGQADLCVHSTFTRSAQTDSTNEDIVDFFDSYLRYQGKDDKWADCGRSYFAQRVRHFTAQNATIEFCLPAFPCKSSNRDKVTGPDPDRGEELALEHLHGFVEAVEQIYPPGAKLWIISDGHVFSDCIGVDDVDVDGYGEKLKKMNEAIGLRRGSTTRVGFKSLVDLFQLASVGPQGNLAGLTGILNVPNIDHHVKTEVTEEAELCRRILMAGCGPQKTAVRAKIDSKDPAITALYRGFSRFMLEDLEHHPHTQGLSRSQQKKLSAKVAFEMILRNQAYSNLVEMLFPNHVRLSIHAHNNAGPKFGIQLFDASQVRAVEGLSPDGQLMTSLDLLHIPTPWHNSVVQLAGSNTILVTKAKLARSALAAGSMTGGLVETEQQTAYFSLATRPSTPPIPAVPNDAEAAVDAKGDTAAVTVTVTVEERGMPTLRKRATFSEKADAVVTAVVRRNTGSLFILEPSSCAGHDTWLKRSSGGGMGGMSGGSGCKISMLWNWNTIDSCFLAKSWKITSNGVFAGSCIGVVLLVMSLEMLRRGVKEYDRFLINKHLKSRAAVGSPVSGMSDDGKPSAASCPAVAASQGYRPTLLEQAIRALLHMLQFAVAYFVMLYVPSVVFKSNQNLTTGSLAMYYNGYIIICIFIGAYLGSFIFHWEPLGGGATN
ncbi:cytochrome P450-dit2 [Collariella sp. IMI 366227]|nr:cytochrome P450-dit2 [Collariella sp. IMI 366227]